MSENIYQCKICNKKFNSNQAHNGHQNVHLNDTLGRANKIKLPCKYCEKEFTKANLKRHEGVCSKNQEFICIECKNIFFIPLNQSKKKFCSSSCSATYNNKKRTKKKMKWYCKNCGKKHEKSNNGKNIYCNNSCQKEFQWRKQTIKIISGIGKHKAVKRYLLEKYGHQCNKCKNNEWNGLPIPIQLEHKDGNHTNNKLENVELLCPNCHAQTSTYGIKNLGNGRYNRRKRYNDGLSF